MVNTRPTMNNLSLTADTEGSLAMLANTVKVTVKLRQTNLAFRIAWITGETATNYIRIGANGSYSMDFKPRNVTFTIYLLSEGGAATAEIETWQA